MALPPKKMGSKSSPTTTGNHTTNMMNKPKPGSGQSQQSSGPFSASPATAGQVHGAIASFINKKKNMSKKKQKQVANKLSTMKKSTASKSKAAGM